MSANCAAYQRGKPFKTEGGIMKGKLRWGFVLVIVLCATPWGTARAQLTFDASYYTGLADANSSQTIPPGTKITLSNWQQFKQFMPISMFAAFSQKYGWKVGPGPEFTMEVGPTTNYKTPKALQENTEKYGGQAKVKAVEGGGYTLKGYVAGIPFPNPAEPDMAYKVFYNAWSGYVPDKARYVTNAASLDRFGNNFPQTTEVISWRLSHISDEGIPANPPFGKGWLQSNRFFVQSPEQTKYTTQLALLPDDPEKLQEIYVFLPSLRRSLRLSSAARCSPILGTDWLQDDNGDGMFLQPPSFAMKLLGEKKVLQMMNGDNANYYGETNMNKKGYPGLPMPSMGKWELRDMYVLDITPLAKAGSYCYSHKVAFIDKQTWFGTWFDNYDAHGKYWKSQQMLGHPLTLSSGEIYVIHGFNTESMVDFQNTHAGISMMQAAPTFGKACPGDCQQSEIYAFPGGLSRIMR
jgi:hypothetical protein